MKKTIVNKFDLLLLILAIPFFYFTSIYDENKLKNSPKLNFENSLDIYVKEISFERNGLYLNDIQHQAYGISGYSKVHLLGTNKELTLKEIIPPFKMEKKEKNDTLKIKKNDVYYLLVTEEINLRKN
ncbi:hypothetical protein [uncultured Flavobacterium sp.]|jgi:hypothetical protein|uniref:hypothetical protein n=1 Tax=uncultured Flavobacterium sp. TaxID=165435 RepID=UPI0012092093|nr:hypothetical protein [uncultured Flavobacterium sp.]THD31554.1 MAG: hypothetical protein DI588_12405 [Flavobacterium johnsoniae]